MTQIPEYDRGYRDGMRQAITWLHAEAKEMNDSRAAMVLNNASFHLGQSRLAGIGGGKKGEQ